MASKKQSYTLEDCTVSFNGDIVGGAQNVTVSYEQENQPQYEAGSKFAREIMPGQVGVTGSVGRLHLDAEQITETMDLEEGNNPYFTITGKTKNKTPEKTIVIEDAMFKSFNLDLGLTEGTLLNQDFDAIRVTPK